MPWLECLSAISASTPRSRAVRSASGPALKGGAKPDVVDCGRSLYRGTLKLERDESLGVPPALHAPTPLLVNPWERIG
jgi:hypothetical protein